MNQSRSDNGKLRVLDLFSGIGGFSLGLERAGGFRTVAFCEIDPYCRAVLRKHWPDVPIHEDVTKLNASDVGSVDVICGGFPCQDISLAGAGAGIEGERSGLWREYARLIRELRPRFAIVENVAALLGRGVGRVLGDLAEIGYDAEWDCIPAAAVGALHYRDRFWLIAYPDANSVRPQRIRPSASGAWGEQQFARLVQDQIQLSVPAGRLRSLSDGVLGRMGQLRGFGNAVVPQIPEIIGKAILQAEASH
jgi:DNA (cytosine-5)-methyltransferase 1